MAEENFTTLELNDTPKPKKSGFWRVFWAIIMFFSIVSNIVMLLIVVVLGSMAFSGNAGIYDQSVFKQGSRNRIAIIGITNVIDSNMAHKFSEQISAAAEDDSVKGLIIRTQSPGGSVVASDEIHHMIMDYKAKTGKPVIAFMQGLAASGGYYTSVAADEIIAEPTTITGSIGVIMQTFTLQELFEEKLGVHAVTVKSGPKKDWPNSFNTVTDEQKEYLQQKLIRPAYNRFVKLIDEGRPDLSLETIKQLADGSIYHADEAKENGLIDDIGYMQDAIDLCAKRARISNPTVFEYREQFGLADIFAESKATSSLLKIDRDTLNEFQTPQLLCLWTLE